MDHPPPAPPPAPSRRALPLVLLLASAGAAAAGDGPPAPYAASRPLPAPARFLEGVVSTGVDDAHAAFSPDGRELYFIRNTPDFAHWTVLVMKFASGRWSQPEVAPFSGRWNDADVTVTRDGKRMFLISNRPLSGEGPPRPDTDLWTMEREKSGEWGKPRHLVELTSPTDEWFPTVTDDGTLYFGSERPGGKGKSDLWRAKWLGDKFGPPENLGDPLNTPEQEIEPYISPDERFMIFSAVRLERKAAYDLFVTFRCDGRWTPPRPLGAGVNSERWEFGARISPDGRYLFFTSNRSEFDPAPAKPRTVADLTRALSSPGNGLRDVYQVDLQALDLRSPCEPR